MLGRMCTPRSRLVAHRAEDKVRASGVSRPKGAAMPMHLSSVGSLPRLRLDFPIRRARSTGACVLTRHRLAESRGIDAIADFYEFTRERHRGIYTLGAEATELSNSPPTSGSRVGDTPRLVFTRGRRSVNLVAWRGVVRTARGLHVAIPRWSTTELSSLAALAGNRRKSSATSGAPRGCRLSPRRGADRSHQCARDHTDVLTHSSRSATRPAVVRARVGAIVWSTRPGGSAPHVDRRPRPPLSPSRGTDARSHASGGLLATRALSMTWALFGGAT